MEGLTLNPDFWNGKRVLLTGHTGFKGTWLAWWLKKMGAVVTGYALPPNTTPSLFELTGLHKVINSVFGDISDLNSLNEVVKKNKPEIIFHMAAQPLVRYSYENPVETFRTNVLGTVHVLETVRHMNTVRSVVIVTSDKCYKNKNLERGYVETDEMGGFDPYSNSKGCAELVTQSYRDSFFASENSFVSIASARAGNVIGGGDWSQDRLVPDIITAFLAKKPAVIRQPEAIRPWQHVIEPLHGYLLLAQNNYRKEFAYNQGFNFGPKIEDAKTVEWMATQLQRLWGHDAELILNKQNSGYHEARILKLDCQQAEKLLNWQSEWRLEQRLEKTVSWYRQVAEDPSCAQSLLLEQISSYLEKK